MVGQGVDKNEREAVDLWTKSASQGNADAQCILGICYNEGKGVVKNQGEAIKLWTKSAAQGNRRAKEELEKIKLK
jgi:TPR repeat protein